MKDYHKNFSIAKIIYKYDEKGNKIEEKHYSFDEIITKHTYVYDKKGKVTQGYQYYIINGEDELHLKTIYEYDSNGNEIVSNSYLSNDALFMKRTYVWDKKNNLLKSDIDGDVGMISEYEYDIHGNWIKQISTVGELLPSIYEREIEYY